jgi:hypothetical protein
MSHLRAAIGKMEDGLTDSTSQVKRVREMVDGLELKGFQEGQLRVVSDLIVQVKKLIEFVEVLEGTIFDATQLKLRAKKGSGPASETDEVQAERSRAERHRRDEIPEPEMMRSGGEV